MVDGRGGNEVDACLRGMDLTDPCFHGPPLSAGQSLGYVQGCGLLLWVFSVPLRERGWPKLGLCSRLRPIAVGVFCTITGAGLAKAWARFKAAAYCCGCFLYHYGSGAGQSLGYVQGCGLLLWVFSVPLRERGWPKLGLCSRLRPIAVGVFCTITGAGLAKAWAMFKAAAYCCGCFLYHYGSGALCGVWALTRTRGRSDGGHENVPWENKYTAVCDHKMHLPLTPWGDAWCNG